MMETRLVTHNLKGTCFNQFALNKYRDAVCPLRIASTDEIRLGKLSLIATRADLQIILLLTNISAPGMPLPNEF